MSSIRNAQLELSALSASNADWANAARQLLQQPALAHEPAVGQLLARQHELWAQLDPALPPLALSPPAAGEAAPAAPAAPAQRRQAESSESQVLPDALVSSQSQLQADRSEGAPPPAAVVQADRAVVCGGEDSVEPGPAPQAAAGADGAAGGADRTVLLRRWRRWLSHLQRRVETRLLRAAVYGWRLAAVSLSVRRQATLRVGRFAQGMGGRIPGGRLAPAGEPQRAAAAVGAGAGDAERGRGGEQRRALAAPSSRGRAAGAAWTAREQPDGEKWRQRGLATSRSAAELACVRHKRSCIQHHKHHTAFVSTIITWTWPWQRRSTSP